MSVLIIDDSRAIRSILTRILVELGFEVHDARNGREGLDRLVELDTIELALVDRNMPGMDGLEFVRAVRCRREFDGVRLMMVTSETNMDRVAEALEQGADEYLMKPFNSEMISQKLEILGISSPGAGRLPPVPR